MFDPRTNRYPYPEETDRHYLEIHKDRGIVFDSSYPYIDISGMFRFRPSTATRRTTCGSCST